MKCEECQSLIEEYVDGEISAVVAENVEKHIGGCEICARAAQDLRAEQQLYAAYEPAVEFTPQLWAGIKARIGEPETIAGQGRFEWLRSVFATAFTVPRFSGWATAALVLIAIGTTAIFMKYTQRAPQLVAPPNNAVIAHKPAEPPSVPIIDVTPSPTAVSVGANSDRATQRRQPVTARSNVAVQRVQQSAATRTPNQLVHEAEQKYLMAIALLSRDATRKRSQIDPATRARLERAIASIDRTIAGTRQAVRQHPGDPVAVQYMLSAYARKVDLLRDIAAQ